LHAIMVLAYMPAATGACSLNYTMLDYICTQLPAAALLPDRPLPLVLTTAPFRLLSQLLGQIVNANSASPANTCASRPCCDVEGASVQCATVTVGCIADVKLCVGGAVGNLLDAILGPLDVILGTRQLPITVAPLRL